MTSRGRQGSFPNSYSHGSYSLCLNCWSSKLGGYMDDESIMGFCRDWSVYCKMCSWSIP